jgi:hypothetical protein
MNKIVQKTAKIGANLVFGPPMDVDVQLGVCKGVDDGRRPPTPWASHP